MELSYDRRGDGPPLVLLHGIGSYRGAWSAVLDRLAAERDVIVPDLPGHGDSSLLADGRPHDVGALADSLENLFGELGVDRPHVAGNSLGGGIALELARRDAVRSATAVSPIGFWKPSEVRFARLSLLGSRALARSLRPVWPQLVRSNASRTALFGQIYGRPQRLQPDAALAALAAFVDAKGFDAALPYTSRYYYWGRPQDPVTVAWGTRDRLLPFRQAERARRTLPEARHVRLDGCGHVPMSDDPERVADVLLTGSAR